MSSQTIYKSYKYRLYPDVDQAHTLAVWFGCVRFVKNKLISNFNSWSTLVSMIEYKSNWYGKTFHQIDRWYPSSKTCSCCGHKVDKLPLDIREWTCSNCNTHHDRDINAAINIKNQGQLDCYEQLLDQFWSDGTADQELQIPMRLEKYASKTERPGTLVPVGIGTDEDTQSLMEY